MAKIRKRGNSYQIDYFDPNGKRVRKSFGKKKDAEAELGKRVSLIAENRYLDVKRDYRTTLGELLDEYAKNYQSQASFISCKQFYIENFREYFGNDTRLSNIKFLQLETYRNYLKNKLTPAGTIRKEASINREISCLHHIFTKAFEWEMIEQNPFEKGRSLLLKEDNRRVRYLTEDEVERLLDECRHKPHLYRIVMCALHTGMRRKEILTLKWSQIRNGFIYLEKTKNKNRREIPINDSLREILKEIRRDQGLSSQSVFAYAGRSIRFVDTGFNGAVRRAEIDDFHFHDLRHTFASHVIMKGGSLKDVQELLGHKTMAMTLRYAHLSQEHKKKAVNLLNNLTSNVTFMSHSKNQTSNISK